MRRSGFIWGLIIFLVGLLLLLQNLGVLTFIQVSIWAIIGPLVLIGLGIWLLVGVSSGGGAVETEALVAPYEGATRAEVRVNYPAGELRIEGGAPVGELLTGTFDGGVAHEVRHAGDVARLRLWSPARVVGPWDWFGSLRRRWEVHLSETLPLELSVEVAAGDARLDLTQLQVTRLRLKTDAGSTQATLPANAGYTEVRASGAAGTLNLRVPEGVAARIRTSGDLSSISVDRSRFPRSDDGYVSPDYETAANKMDIDLKMDVGSASVR